MIRSSRLRIVALALAAIVAVSAAGYWGVGEYRQRKLNKAVVALVADTSTRLRNALSSEASAAGANPVDISRHFDNQANEVDSRLQALRRLDGAPNRPLVDAAELYIVTARELLRRKASTYRYSVELANSRKALQDQMQDARRRSTSWIGQTMRAKEQFEQNSFKYRIAVDAIGNLLESLPRARTQLLPYLDESQLLEESLRMKAYDQAREASKRTTDEVEEIKRFVAAR